MLRDRLRTVGQRLTLPALVVFLALATALGATLLTSTPTEASSSPFFSINRTYFSSPAKTQRVGFLTCNCQGEENLAWGHATPYFEDLVTGFCSGGGF